MIKVENADWKLYHSLNSQKTNILVKLLEMKTSILEVVQLMTHVGYFLPFMSNMESFLNFIFPPSETECCCGTHEIGFPVYSIYFIFKKYWLIKEDNITSGEMSSNKFAILLHRENFLCAHC